MRFALTTSLTSNAAHAYFSSLGYLPTLESIQGPSICRASESTRSSSSHKVLEFSQGPVVVEWPPAIPFRSERTRNVSPHVPAVYTRTLSLYETLEFIQGFSLNKSLEFLQRKSLAKPLCRSTPQPLCRTSVQPLGHSVAPRKALGWHLHS